MRKRSTSVKKTHKSADAAAFGKALHLLRIEKGLSQEELSFRSEVDRSYVGQLERGEKEPCLAVILKLARALGMQPSEIFQAIEKSVIRWT